MLPVLTHSVPTLRSSDLGCPGCAPGVLETCRRLDGVSPGRATLDHSASLNVEGDLDLKVHVALDDWTPATNMAFMSKFIGSTDRSFIFQVFTSGTLRLIWTTDGTAGTQVSATSTVAPTIANGDDLWIRVKLDVDNGAGGKDRKGT